MFKKFRVVLVKSSKSKEGLEKTEKPKNKSKFLGLFRNSSDQGVQQETKTRSSFLRRKKKSNNNDNKDEASSEVLNNHTDQLPVQSLPVQSLLDNVPQENGYLLKKVSSEHEYHDSSKLSVNGLPENGLLENRLPENDLPENDLPKNGLPENELSEKSLPLERFEAPSLSTIDWPDFEPMGPGNLPPTDEAWKRAKEVWERNEIEETKEISRGKRKNKKEKKEHNEKLKEKDGRERKTGKSRERSKSRDKDKEPGNERSDSKNRSKERKKHEKREERYEGEKHDQKHDAKLSKEEKHKKHKPKSEKHRQKYEKGEELERFDRYELEQYSYENEDKYKDHKHKDDKHYEHEYEKHPNKHEHREHKDDKHPNKHEHREHKDDKHPNKHEHREHKDDKHPNKHEQREHKDDKHHEQKRKHHPKPDHKYSTLEHTKKLTSSDEKRVELDKVWREYEAGKRYHTQGKDMKKVIDRLDGVERYRKEERQRSTDRSSDTSHELVHRSRSRERQRQRSRSREKHRHVSDQESNHSSTWDYSLGRIEARQEQCTADIDLARRSIEHRIKLLEMRLDKQYSSSEIIPDRTPEKPREVHECKRIIDQVADECREVTRTLEVRTEQMKTEIATVVKEQFSHLDERLERQAKSPSSPVSFFGMRVVGNFQCEETPKIFPAKTIEDDVLKRDASMTSTERISSADESMVTVIEENSRVNRCAPTELTNSQSCSSPSSRDSQIRVSQSGALDTLEQPTEGKAPGTSLEHPGSPLQIRSQGIHNLHELSLESIDDQLKPGETGDQEGTDSDGTPESSQIMYRRRIRETEERCQERAVVEKEILFKRIDELEAMLLAAKSAKDT